MTRSYRHLEVPPEAARAYARLGELAAATKTPCQADPEAWFVRSGPARREAEEACGYCPIREACKAYNELGSEEYGVWAGETGGYRQHLTEIHARYNARKKAQAGPGDTNGAGPVSQEGAA